MAIEKVVEIKVDYKEALKNLNSINETIDEQRAILVLLEDEYLKAKKALEAYNKSGKVNLAQEKALKKELSERKDAIDDQRQALKQFAVEQREANKAVKEARAGQQEQNVIIRAIDKLTGGYASKLMKLGKGVKAATKGVKGLTFSFKAFKTALITTGIGAVVLGIQLLIENFDKVKGFFTGITQESEEAAKKLKEENDALLNSIAKNSSALISVQRAYESGSLKGKELQNVVDQLNSKYKDANIELDENNKLTEESLAFIDAQVEQIKKAAKNKALQTKIEELYRLELEAQQQVGIKNIELQEKALEIEDLIAQKRAAIASGERYEVEKFNKQIRNRKKELAEIAGEVGEAVSDRAKLQEAIDANVAKLDFTGVIDKVDKTVDEKTLKARENFLKKLAEDVAEEDLLLDTEDLLPEEQPGQMSTKDEAEIEALRLKYEIMNMTDLERLNFEEQIALQRIEALGGSEEAREAVEEHFRLKRKEAKEKEDKEEKDRIEEQEKYKEEEYRKGYETLQSLVAMGGKKMAAVGKALAIGDVVRTSVKAIGSTIASTTEANAKAVAASPLTGGMPFVAINTAKAALSIGKTVAGAAKSIKAIKGDAKSVSGAGAADTGGGGGAAPQAPSFNIVGATETSQLAEAIGEQTQQPVQAYVVANDVTTAQSLNNNIVESSTLG